MFKWLHKFFYTDDEVEIVKLAGGLSEYDSAQYEELLRNQGITVMRKNTATMAAYRLVYPGLIQDNYALFVKQGDVERAIQVLGPLLGHGKLAGQAAESRREARRFRRWLKP